MTYKKAVSMVDSNRFSVTSADSDVIIINALTTVGDAIPVRRLIDDMAYFNFHLGYVIPDAREFQFKSR